MTLLVAPDTADVVVVGAGVIGCSVAYHISKRGYSVLLVDRGDMCSGTSGACENAVMIQSKVPGPHLSLALTSARMFEELVDELGEDIEYVREGGMLVAADEDQYEVLARFAEQQRAAGLPVYMLSPREAREIQPALSPRIAGSSWCELDAHVNPFLLCRALLRGLKSRGGRFWLHTEVRSLVTEKGRVTGVETAWGRVTAGLVVVAAGVWTPVLVGPVGVSLPVTPVRGQMLVSERLASLVRGTVLCARYLVEKIGHRLGALPGGSPRGADSSSLGIGLSLGQTKSGNLLLGGSRERVGFDTGTTVEGLVAIARYALGLVPGLARVSFVRCYAGLRPQTPDGLPVIGAVPGVPGLVVATGHGGDGIALSPVTGWLVAEIVETGRLPEVARAFAPDRFGRGCEVAGEEVGTQGRQE